MYNYDTQTTILSYLSFQEMKTLDKNLLIYPVDPIIEKLHKDQAYQKVTHHITQQLAELSKDSKLQFQTSIMYNLLTSNDISTNQGLKNSIPSLFNSKNNFKSSL